MKITYITGKEALQRLSIYLAKNYDELYDKYYSDDYILQFRFDLTEGQRACIDIYAEIEVDITLLDKIHYGFESIMIDTIFLDQIDGIPEKHEIVIKNSKKDE